MLGNQGVVPNNATSNPVGTVPDSVIPKLKDPTVALASNDEGIKAASQGGFDTKGSMLGTLSGAPKVPDTFPTGTAPVVVTAPAVNVKADTSAKGSMPPKETLPVKTGSQKAPLPETSQKEKTSPSPQNIVTVSTSHSAPQKPSSSSSQKSVAGKQVQALGCAISELQELAKGMGDDGGSLRTELNGFLETIRKELNKPCSGRSETQNIQTISLSSLTKGAKKREDHLEGNVLVTRDEKSCEAHLDVQYATSLKSASSGSPGQPSNEGQSIIHIDKNGFIVAAETTAGVKKCLAQ